MEVHIYQIKELEGKAFRKSCGNGCPYSTIDDLELAFVVVVDGIEESLILQKIELEVIKSNLKIRMYLK